jgi:hypothetical protein
LEHLVRSVEQDRTPSSSTVSITECGDLWRRKASSVVKDSKFTTLYAQGVRLLQSGNLIGKGIQRVKENGEREAWLEVSRCLSSGAAHKSMARIAIGGIRL